MDEKKLNQAKLGAIITAEDTRLVEELIGIDENGKIDLAKLEQRLPDLKRILASAIAERKLLKHPMPEQNPEVRSHNFDEVALGYTEEMAIAEAKRCLNCKKPMCRAGCPVSVRILFIIMCSSCTRTLRVSPFTMQAASSWVESAWKSICKSSFPFH